MHTTVCDRSRGASLCPPPSHRRPGVGQSGQSVRLSPSAARAAPPVRSPGGTALALDTHLEVTRRLDPATDTTTPPEWGTGK